MRPEDLARMSIQELRQRFLVDGVSLPDDCEAVLASDPRAGARTVWNAIQRRRQENRAEGQRLRNLLRWETRLWDEGKVHVAGVDEAGMAPLAGPVVAGAVVLPHDYRPRGIDDSKAIDAAERERLAADIKANAISWAIGMASEEEIDRINIYQAGLLALRRAVLGLRPQPQHLLVDARRLDLPMPQQPIIKGDAKSLTIGAASIVAKVHRDRLMSDLDLLHPGYNLAANKGYPTPDHLEALTRLGACPIHRRTFGPVTKALGLDAASKQGSLFG